MTSKPDVRAFILKHLQVGRLKPTELIGRGRAHHFSEAATRSEIELMIDEGIIDADRKLNLYIRRPAH